MYVLGPNLPYALDVARREAKELGKPRYLWRNEQGNYQCCSNSPPENQASYWIVEPSGNAHEQHVGGLQ